MHGAALPRRAGIVSDFTSRPAPWCGQCPLLPLGDGFGRGIFVPVLCLIRFKFPLSVQIIEERCEPLRVACSAREGTDACCGKQGVQQGLCPAVTLGQPGAVTGARTNTWLPARSAAGPGLGWLLLLPPYKAVEAKFPRGRLRFVFCVELSK